jgi:hypothetical protein
MNSSDYRCLIPLVCQPAVAIIISIIAICAHSDIVGIGFDGIGVVEDTHAPSVLYNACEEDGLLETMPHSVLLIISLQR